MKYLVAAALFALTAPLFTAGPASAATSEVQTAGPITISCYRGPWKAVIVDRPNPVFVDTLVAAGHDLATAYAVADRICTDPALLDRPEAMVAKLQEMLGQ